MKRIFTSLLTLLLTLAIQADNIEVDGIYYELTSLSTAAVTYNMKAAGNYETYEGDVVIPEKFTYKDKEYTVTEIGPQAFLQSKNMTSVVIPETVKQIQANAFGSCTGLTSISIPNSVEKFGDFVFSSCTKLKTVHLGNGIKKLNGRMFQGCTKLESINLPEGLESIEDYTFEVCRSLPSIEIPSTVNYIGLFVFKACDALKTIRVAAGNSKYDSREDCNAVIETATNRLVAGCKASTFPNSVTAIGEYAFSEIRGLQSVTIPGNVKTIERFAFEKNTILTLTLSDGVETIGEYAFDNCGSMTTLSLPTTISAIGGYAFNKCMNLTTVYAFMPEPFLLDGTAFARIPAACVLYVPKGTRDAYLEANWNESTFGGGVIEMDGTGVSTNVADAHSTVVRKVLDNGRVTIITPENRKYSANGAEVK